MAATPANSLTLISSGLQDSRLLVPKGNPNVEQFVKVVHKTTRWAAQWVRAEFDGSPEFGQRVSLTLPRAGELVTAITIAVTMPDIYTTQLNAIKACGGTDLNNTGTFLGPIYGWTNNLGHALIQMIEFEVSGTCVEALDSRMLEFMDELYETIESTIAKNAMIKRAPNGYTAKTWLTPEPTQVFIPIPFWFSRPGMTSHALPLDAMSADIVRIHVTFRPLSQLYYTEARVDTRTVGYTASMGANGAMYPLANGKFWRSNPSATGNVYTMSRAMGVNPVFGEVVPDFQMPARASPIDAYALIEYISLEEQEAIGFRSSELTYHVEQHIAVPVQQTLEQREVRVPLPFSNPTKEIVWMFQRPEALTYNAHFLFTRDLGPVIPPQDGPYTPCSIPWWPDAILLPTQANRWQLVPAFQSAYSEPMADATLLYNSIERFVHEGGSFFRSMVPALYYTKSAVHDRYIYAYSFGQKALPRTYGPTGAANWDKLARKEFFCTLNYSRLNTAPPNLNLYMYITQWNIFKVFGGRGGLLFNT